MKFGISDNGMGRISKVVKSYIPSDELTKVSNEVMEEAVINFINTLQEKIEFFKGQKREDITNYIEDHIDGYLDRIKTEIEGSISGLLMEDMDLEIPKDNTEQ